MQDVEWIKAWHKIKHTIWYHILGSQSDKLIYGVKMQGNVYIWRGGGRNDLEVECVML